MDEKDRALLSAAVALTLISEKVRFQAARTPDTEARTSLLEVHGQCVTTIQQIQAVRNKAIAALKG